MNVRPPIPSLCLLTTPAVGAAGNNNANSNAPAGGGGGGGGGGKGEYQKPWQAGMRGQEKAGGGGKGPGGKDGKKEKKEYVGPDADLAPVLEREVLDYAPGIK